MIGRRVLAAGLLGMPALRRAVAQEAFPTRPIQVVNPYPAGGATDLLARAMAAGLAPRLGQPVVVINRDGAAGSVGTAAVARSAPDGHTLAFVPALVLSVLPITQPASGLRPDSLRPVCQMFSNAQAIAVRADSPFRTLGDLVAAAKASAWRDHLRLPRHRLHPAPRHASVDPGRRDRTDPRAAPR